jgi:hypothetical protein
MSDDPAQARFLVIQLVRTVGVAMILAGIAVTQGAIDWPQPVGFVLMGLGFFETFIAPRLLAKKWKSPDA